MPRGMECTLAKWVRAQGARGLRWHTPTTRTHTRAGHAQALTYKDMWALQRHRETLSNPSSKPKPLGAAVSTLLGACTSQSSGHDGGRHGREVGRCWGSSPLFLVQVGLSLVTALQGLPLLSLSFQPQTARPVWRRPLASLAAHLPSTATPRVA